MIIMRNWGLSKMANIDCATKMINVVRSKSIILKGRMYSLETQGVYLSLFYRYLHYHDPSGTLIIKIMTMIANNEKNLNKLMFVRAAKVRPT